FEWGIEQQEAFDVLKQAFVTEPVLRYPKTNEPFIDKSDSSKTAPGVGDITVTKVTPDSLTVVWQEPTSAPRCTQGYKLVLSQDRQFKQQINKTTVGIPESRTYTFTGLYQCTLYYISVQAMPNLQFKYTSSFTSVISNATVKDLTTDNVYEDRIKVSWIPFDHWLSCVLEYKVEIISGPFYYNIPTNNTDLEISGLEPCTTYGIHVTVLFWGGWPSQQSAGITARTLPGGKHLNEPVQQIQVQNKSDRSLTISWQGPKSGMSCVDSYIVYIQDSKRYRVSSELTNHTVFEFTNLKECEVYYVHVRPHYYGTTSTASTLHQPKDSFIVTNTTAPDNVVVDLRMKAGWNSLQLDWTLRDLYRNCVSEYVVQVCFNGLSG
ncbi:receptor-type tyrosine-protein phosphatase eta-like, partial [Homalodisca vitripennis]|uniref:receptor-type tyrosine-protein phosphatase eta-like n=1 Tax=Homalodisca vitripennis TaxID=197043 RepID=UPI001EEABDF5